MNNGTGDCMKKRNETKKRKEKMAKGRRNANEETVKETKTTFVFRASARIEAIGNPCAVAKQNHSSDECSFQQTPRNEAHGLTQSPSSGVLGRHLPNHRQSSVAARCRCRAPAHGGAVAVAAAHCRGWRPPRRGPTAPPARRRCRAADGKQPRIHWLPKEHPSVKIGVNGRLVTFCVMQYPG